MFDWRGPGGPIEHDPDELPALRADEEPSRARTLLEIPVLLVFAALIALVVKTFVAQAFYIPSASMEPQLTAGDRVLVSSLAYDLHEPRRGDIVVFDDPLEVDDGATLSIEDDGTVYIGDRPLREPYLADDVVQADFPATVVPTDHVFVMGDNRSNSKDSRVFHAVPVDSIVGRAIARVWPPGRIAFL